MKLNLGCGTRQIHGFINVDIDPQVKPDVVDDISQLATFEDESASLIYACHVLEHFGRHDVNNVLKQWNRVLRLNGVLRLSVPNLEAVAKYYLEKGQIEKVMGFLVGGQKSVYDWHGCCFDFWSLKTRLEVCGFRDIHRYDWHLTEHAYVDDYSQSYLPHMDKLNGTLMSLNLQAIK